MPDKQKVTLYLSDDLHRQFKIRSAVDGETMSSMAQRAIEFYLSHADVVAHSGSHGHAHQVHSCPQCSAAVVLKEGELALVARHDQIVADELMEIAQLPTLASDASEESSGCDCNSENSDEGKLVPC